MSSQVISYRLSTDEVLALRQKALPGESDNQTAQRLIRESLGLSTELSTKLSTMSTDTLSSLDERIESIVDDKLSSFAANQNELLTRLQDSLQERILQELESRIAALAVPPSQSPVSHSVDTVDNSVDDGEDMLTQAELAKRLRVDTGTLTKNRSKPNFTAWTQSKDPEQKAWSYLPEVKRYSSLPSTGLSTMSTADEDTTDLTGWQKRVDEVVGSL